MKFDALLMQVLSRLGHMSYDVGAQILQTGIPSSKANLIGTTEISVASLVECAMLGVAIIANDVSHFGVLATLSLLSVVGAACIFGVVHFAQVNMELARIEANFNGLSPRFFQSYITKHFDEGRKEDHTWDRFSRRKQLLELLPENSVAILAAAPVKMMTDVPYTYQQDADYLYIIGSEQPGGLAVLSHEYGLCMSMPETSPHTDFKLASSHHPLNDKVAHECGFTSLSVRIVKTIRLRKLSMFVSYARNIVGVSVHFHPLKMAKSNLHRHNLSLKPLTQIPQSPFNQLGDMLMKEGDITPGIGAEEYISRRKRLLELLPENSVAILAAAPVKMMTDVVPYTYRRDADYLYITGCEQPGGLAVLSHECGLCMFMLETSPHDVNWKGPVAGVEAALETFKAEKAYPMRKIHEEELYDLMLQTNKECLKLCKPGANLLDTHHYSDSSTISYEHTLEPGVVITIELGFYIPSSFDGPERFRGIRIRIEDEVLITETGYEVLTRSMPKEIKHIESLLNNFSHGMGMVSCSNVKAATS
ncbi:hypothetical protein LWI28_010390 [Acer negundo]|uniref:Solute carrier family 40 member n=1 Tax=Acer negundo TaxID=4023 RepID=A0AAD5J4Z7_ACENE|nr:hypothetical protein LWI28_010390 [Acer negundo]